MEEIREFKRVGVSFTVLYKVNYPLNVQMQIGNREFDATALDLSEGGMAVLTKYKNYVIPAFAIVTVKFKMLNNGVSKNNVQPRSIEIKGEVRSSLFMKEKGAYRLGINFINISDEESRFIANFVKRSSSKT